MTDKLPPAQEQFDILCRGTVDLHPEDDFLRRLQKSHELQKPLLIKLGCDPTAPDLHLGHTVVIEKMAQFQRFGHQVVFLVGDYTALIGDPSGRNKTRPPLTSEEVAAHAGTYTEQCFKILDRDKTRVVFNSEWLAKLSFRDMLSLTSKYNLGRMLERRDFKDRLESNKQIAMHELLYPLMQGYDSVALANDVELGGHDQIFNLNVGRHLMEAYSQPPQIVMTVGLLVGLDGKEKMSKSKNNTIGITEGPEDIFGKAMSISDDTMKTWVPLLLGQTYQDAQNPLTQKKHLAHALVQRFCSKPAADDILAWWDAGRPPRNVAHKSLPCATLQKLVLGAGGASSGADARRKIVQGGVSLNGERCTDPTQVVQVGGYLLRVGKNWMVQLEVTPSASSG